MAGQTAPGVLPDGPEMPGTALGLGDPQGLADHQRPGQEEEQDDGVPLDTEYIDRIERAAGEREHQERERHDARRDRRAFEVFDLARLRREALGRDVVESEEGPPPT